MKALKKKGNQPSAIALGVPAEERVYRPELIEHLGCSEDTFRRWMRMGKIPRPHCELSEWWVRSELAWKKPDH